MRFIIIIDLIIIMQSFQIVGTFSFSDNIKMLNVGDRVKLLPNPDNKINPLSIGVYSEGMKKIGYLPFNTNQVDSLDLPCHVSKLNLLEGDTIIIISRENKNRNFLSYLPTLIKSNRKIGIMKNVLVKEINSFKKFLERNSHTVLSIGITYMDENFIDLYIKTLDNEMIFNTVTHSFYQQNILKYEEFALHNLFHETIYQPFKIHCLENYIIKNYKQISIKNITKELEDAKIIIKYAISPIPFYKEYIDTLDKSNRMLDYIDIDYLKTFNISSIYYSHDDKMYCNVDFYNNESCILIDKYHVKYDKYYNKITRLISPRKLLILDPFSGKIIEIL